MGAWSVVTVSALIASLLLPRPLAARDVGPAGETLALSSLRRGCRVSFAGGGPGNLPEVWLDCGVTSYRVLGRESLEKQVEIRTEKDALEFVRVFNRADTWYLSSLRSETELLVAKRDDPLRFEVSVKEFRRCCVPPRAEIDPSEDGGYIVSRTLMRRDGRVFAVRESVSKEGRVHRFEERLLLENGTHLGRFWHPYLM